MSQTLHLLIVEDSIDLQELLKDLFFAEGYEVSQAFNGQQALEMLRTMPKLPSLILLDVMMPVMDGVEFRLRQNASPALAQIPVIVMSADPNVQARIYPQVANVIRKPIQNLDEFLSAIAKTLPPAS